MNNEIVLLKLYNGEYIIGKFDSEFEDKLLLKEPRVIFMVPTRTGEMAAMVKPICFPFTSNRLKESIEIYKSQIEFQLYDKMGEIEKDLLDGYNSEISGIEIASASTLNAIDAAASKQNSGLIL